MKENLKAIRAKQQTLKEKKVEENLPPQQFKLSKFKNVESRVNQSGRPDTAKSSRPGTGLAYKKPRAQKVFHEADMETNHD